MGLGSQNQREQVEPQGMGVLSLVVEEDQSTMFAIGEQMEQKGLEIEIVDG